MPTSLLAVYQELRSDWSAREPAASVMGVLGRAAWSEWSTEGDTFGLELPYPSWAKAVTADLVKVGPKGYIHGWIKVGAAGAVGDLVHHPEHGHGKVTRVGSKTVGVQFHSGAYHAFEHGGTGEGHFVPRGGRVAKPAPASAPQGDVVGRIAQELGMGQGHAYSSDAKVLMFARGELAGGASLTDAADRLERFILGPDGNSYLHHNVPSEERDAARQQWRDFAGRLRQADVPGRTAKPATPKRQPLPGLRMNKLEHGDHIVWESPGEAPVHGTVRREGKGKRTHIDWDNGRSEPVSRAGREPNMRMATDEERAGRVAKPAASVATVAKPAALTPAEHYDRLHAMSSRDEGRQYVAGIKGKELQALADHLSVSRGTAGERREHIVESAVGARLDSQAIRGGNWLERTRPARLRQAAIDHVRPVAELAAHLDEYHHSLGNETPADERTNVLGEVVDAGLSDIARRQGLVLAENRPVAVGPGMEALRRSPHDRVAADARTLAGEHGIALHGSSGDVVPFNPAKHKLIDGDVRTGTPVEVVRPGTSMRHGDETISLSKADVFEAGRPSPSPRMQAEALHVEAAARQRALDAGLPAAGSTSRRHHVPAGPVGTGQGATATGWEQRLAEQRQVDELHARAEQVAATPVSAPEVTRAAEDRILAMDRPGAPTHIRETAAGIRERRVLASTHTEPTGAQREALKRYGGDGGYVINAALRSDAPLDQRNRDTVDALDSLMRDSPLPHDIVVHRLTPVSRNQFGSGEGGTATIDETSLVGSSWQDKAYVSTSVDDRSSTVNYRAIAMKITVPAGTSGISNTTLLDTGEVLLDRDLTFHVVADHGKDDRFVRHLDVRVGSPEPRTRITVAPRGGRMPAALRPPPAPRPAAVPKPPKPPPEQVAQQALNHLRAGGQTDATLKALPVAALRELARLHGIVGSLGGRDDVKRMRKPDLIREMTPWFS